MNTEKLNALASQRFLSSIAFSLWLFITGVGLFGITGAHAELESDDACVDCHRRQAGQAGEVVSILQSSTHGRMSIGCVGCHGGDSSEMEKAKAHSDGFIARPDAAATLEMCGRCHRQAIEFFKTSRHFANRPNVKRLDCVECHGVHAIGAASESFRWPQFCAGCHGLEYLPQLPKPFQEMLALADDLSDGLHRLEAQGRPQPQLGQRRKEIRHMISELVHQTNAREPERIRRILESGAKLKQQIESEAKQ